MKKKTVALLLALVLLIGVAAGGTLAWLTDATEKIENTFTTSDVDIELAETTGTSYKMVPGYTIAKDPAVTVKAISEKCWLFVKVERTGNVKVQTAEGEATYGFDDYMTYTVDEEWTALTGVADVYYREVEDTDADQSFAVIKDNTVTVKDTVTKEMMNGTGKYPTLTVTAYACQYYSTNNTAFDVTEAWTNVSNPTGN